MGEKVKVKTFETRGWMPPPVGRHPSLGKDATEERAWGTIVRDEFRTGYSLIGLLASIARLRFTGKPRINPGQGDANRISSNGQ